MVELLVALLNLRVETGLSLLIELLEDLYTDIGVLRIFG